MSALRARWAAFSPRERLLLAGLGALAALVLLWFLIVRPLMAVQSNGIAAYDDAAETRAAVARAARSSGSGAAATGTGPLRNVVSAYADDLGIVIDRYDGQGDSLDVSIAPTNAPTLYAWLDRLAADEGVTVREASVRPGGEPGQVTARLTLGRG